MNNASNYQTKKNKEAVRNCYRTWQSMNSNRTENQFRGNQLIENNHLCSNGNLFPLDIIEYISIISVIAFSFNHFPFFLYQPEPFQTPLQVTDINPSSKCKRSKRQPLPPYSTRPHSPSQAVKVLNDTICKA